MSNAELAGNTDPLLQPFKLKHFRYDGYVGATCRWETTTQSKDIICFSEYTLV